MEGAGSKPRTEVGVWGRGKEKMWPKKSKTTYLAVDPCITNRVMGD